MADERTAAEVVADAIAEAWFESIHDAADRILAALADAELDYDAGVAAGRAEERERCVADLKLIADHTGDVLTSIALVLAAQRIDEGPPQPDAPAAPAPSTEGAET